MNLENYESERLNAESQKYPKTQPPKDPNGSTTSFLLDVPASLPEKLLRLGIIALALLSLAASHVQACGPDFPNNLLDAGDYAVLVAPMVRFGEELHRMQLVQTRWRAVLTTNDYPREAADAEMADLAAALKKLKTSREETMRVCDAHQVQRERLAKYVEDYRRWQGDGDWPSDRNEQPSRAEPQREPPKLTGITIVPGLPGEFEDYFNGACAWRDPATEDKAKARTAWERLLARPEVERKFKSTWAAYMLGKSCEETEPDKAIEHFQQVRELAKRGFNDSLGLATASLGWEARLHLRQSRFREAIHLYLEQLTAGDGSAIESLRETASRALAHPNALPELAKDLRSQKVITAFLVSGHGDLGSGRYMEYDQTDETAAEWLQAVEVADENDVDSAEKLALAAYQTGAFGQAKRWIKRAPNAPLTQWLQAKLLLRDGKLAHAAALLAKVSHSFPLEATGTNAPASLAENLFVSFTDENRAGRGVGAQVLGELGVLRLARHQYTESLDALLRSGFWGDAAYVAERVVTLDELKAYVDQNWPATNATTNDSAEVNEAITPDDAGESIRYLLARRLTRELRGVEAREYYPAEWRPAFDELLARLNEGWDEAQGPTQRAASLFAAAGIARASGMELLGTEVGPDWFIHGGNFEYGVTAAGRTNEDFKLVRASPDELRRAFAHKADPEARFHYRYQAAFLAWEAAKLMPDNSDETAFMLWQAGEWLKYRDPLTADGFYKTLVRRCRKTELGAEADRIRWFPQLDENRRVIPRETKPSTELTPEEMPLDSMPEPILGMIQEDLEPIQTSASAGADP